jgi:hypothetical protein
MLAAQLPPCSPAHLFLPSTTGWPCLARNTNAIPPSLLVGTHTSVPPPPSYKLIPHKKVGGREFEPQTSS